MLSMLLDQLDAFLAWVITVLPADPFMPLITGVQMVTTGLGWLNWLVPFQQLLIIMSAWLIGVALWYVWQALARWLKMVK